MFHQWREEHQEGRMHKALETDRKEGGEREREIDGEREKEREGE